MAEGLEGAGSFIIDQLVLVTSTGLSVDLLTSVMGLTLYEDIETSCITGTIMIQDSVNLASFGPIIGQEYLHLKIRTPSLKGAESTIDFSKNVFIVNSLSSRQQLSRGTQGFVLSFVSQELIKDQRTKVTQSLTGTWSDIFKTIEGKILFDIDLPFFTYGIFQPNHFAYNKIKKFVLNGYPIEDNICGDLWIKDGLLIVNNPEVNNKEFIPGYIVKFEKKFAKEAYDRINEIEPSTMYKAIIAETEKKIKVNILVSKENLIGNQDGDFSKGAILIRANIKQRVEYTSQNRILKESIDVIDTKFKILKKKKKEKDKIPYIINLQMINLHLWGMLERYTAFRYSLKMTPNERITELSNDKDIVAIFNEIIDDHTNKNYFIELRNKKEDKIFEANSFKLGGRLDIEKPSKFIKALYQIRCNITHRGKEDPNNPHGLARNFDIKDDRDIKLLQETTPILIDLTRKIVNN